ncbi:hypothetical protein LH29_24335 [Draconibacterium sediminis]|uniref:Uncharacterized protein n=1 Tax=Draconibacterium sediminis TaxID=1544798 RepID=A0A0D8J4D8_9BACT|nr:hypothetical protein LH29_24335 [Draconibacterium sediminis]
MTKNTICYYSYQIKTLKDLKQISFLNTQILPGTIQNATFFTDALHNYKNMIFITTCALFAFFE